MQHGVDRRGRPRLAARVRFAPRAQEALVVLPPATGARAVAGCHGRRLVEEEELGVAARRHEHALAAIERAVVVALRLACAVDAELARQPQPACVRPHNLALAVVEYTAVAKDRCRRVVAGRMRDDRAPRRDAVAKRHVPWWNERPPRRQHGAICLEQGCGPASSRTAAAGAAASAQTVFVR